MINSSWILIEQWRQLTASVYEAFDHCSTAVAAWRPGFQSTVFQASICQRRRSWIFSLYSNFMAVPCPVWKTTQTTQKKQLNTIYCTVILYATSYRCGSMCCMHSTSFFTPWCNLIAELSKSFPFWVHPLPAFQTHVPQYVCPWNWTWNSKMNTWRPLCKSSLASLAFRIPYHFQRCTPCIASQCCQRISISHPPPIRSL